MKPYSVKNIGARQIEISGDGGTELWTQASELTDFCYPLENESSPSTSFRALHGNDWLYFLFRAKDDNLNVWVETNHKTEVLYSDRVEIFLRKDAIMAPYYGLEIDPYGRVYDYQAYYKSKHDPEWTWPNGHLIIKAKTVKGGYSVEGAISKKSLKQLDLLNGNKLEAGLFRGNCIKIIKGSNSSIKWISWMKPDSPTPNFHIPSAFGVLVLE